MNHSLGSMCCVLTLATAASGQAPGLRLFQPVNNQATQLVDTSGNVVRSWPTTTAVTAHLTPDGSLMRGVRVPGIGANGSTGRIQRLGFDGTVLWDHLVNGPDHFAHHDLEVMPNGNVLLIVWDLDTVADAIAAGRDPALVTGTDWLPDAVLEIQQTGPTTGTIVWEWHMMDHVIQDFDSQKANFGVVANHPELLDLNYPATVISNGDWNHFNGIDYDPASDLIILSAREQSEIYIIDHSTTTAEAAGHTGGNFGKGGDFLWRWGNPHAYGAGTANNQQLTHQHDPRFIPPGHSGAGNITVFNNEHLANQSAVYELVLPRDAQGNFVLDPQTGRYGPSAPHWTFTEPGFFAAFVSGAERLPNGNTLICSGTQFRLFEVTSAGQTVWSWTDPTQNFIFQAQYVDRSMWADTAALPVAGAQVNFDHLHGTALAGETYLLLGSFTGTSPGTTVGGVHLPLNIDFLTSAMASSFNTGIFVNTIGTLDGFGAGSSALAVPGNFIPPGLAGTNLDFAHIVFDASLTTLRASNVTRVTIVP
ncbi:MAG: aryl-sulfate sulfotransferase [bacterium]|nr:aryl-sulfate sulfotransferase [bacterium]